MSTNIYFEISSEGSYEAAALSHKERIKCKFTDKGCEETFTVKGNMVEHMFKCKYNLDGIQEMTCEVCGKGGFFMPKRILAHKRKAHGWDF